ncbi:hypothetical protein [Haloarcula marismortui]|uniref:hypothetical protein n=1 Tax=Haloarcula marismortui TaxID=2238 RepID=UPI0006781752|nr:hypothetical protein [Haloarcula californiae]
MASDVRSLARAGRAILVVPLASGVGAIRATLRALVAVVMSVLGGCWVEAITVEQWLPISAIERLWLFDGDRSLAAPAQTTLTVAVSR